MSFDAGRCSRPGPRATLTSRSSAARLASRRERRKAALSYCSSSDCSRRWVGGTSSLGTRSASVGTCEDRGIRGRTTGRASPHRDRDARRRHTRRRGDPAGGGRSSSDRTVTARGAQRSSQNWRRPSSNRVGNPRLSTSPTRPQARAGGRPPGPERPGAGAAASAPAPERSMRPYGWRTRRWRCSRTPMRRTTRRRLLDSPRSSPRRTSATGPARAAERALGLLSAKEQRRGRPGGRRLASSLRLHRRTRGPGRALRQALSSRLAAGRRGDLRAATGEAGDADAAKRQPGQDRCGAARIGAGTLRSTWSLFVGRGTGGADCRLPQLLFGSSISPRYDDHARPGAVGSLRNFRSRAGNAREIGCGHFRGLPRPAVRARPAQRVRTTDRRYATGGWLGAVRRAWR
jgi:hypothetical protein